MLKLVTPKHWFGQKIYLGTILDFKLLNFEIALFATLKFAILGYLGAFYFGGGEVDKKNCLELKNIKDCDLNFFVWTFLESKT